MTERSGWRADEEGQDSEINAERRQDAYQLGERIVLDIRDESIRHGAIFLLVTRIKELAEAFRDKGFDVLDLSLCWLGSNISFPTTLT
jgi:hypothetical protein